MKFLNGSLIVIMWVLGIFSVIALFSVHWTLVTKYSFSLTPDGLNFYLSQFSAYKELFGATVLIMATYFGLHRLKAATDANILKVKADRFSEWKSVLDVRFPEVEKENPYMKREFIRVRFNLYEQLHGLNFRIDNQQQLTELFQNHFQNSVSFLEEMNEKYMVMAVYRDNTQSYSFDGFRFLFLGCADSIYDNAVRDLQALYIAQLSATRWIDATTYQTALNAYIRRPR